jgi:uncharacterized membrane protein
LVLMMFAGAAIRQYFVMRHGYKHGRSANPWPYAAVGVAVIVAVIAWLAPRSSAPVGAVATPPVVTVAPTVSKAEIPPAVLKVVEQRCVMCHGEQVQMKNIRLDSAESLQKNMAMVYQQVVVTKQMPMNNATGITPEERKLIADWAKP